MADDIAAAAQSPDERAYRLLRPWEQQREEFRAAFAIDDAVDRLRAEAALEGDDGFLGIPDVITEPLECQQEAGVGPERVHQIAGRARQGQAAVGERVPWE